MGTISIRSEKDKMGLSRMYTINPSQRNKTKKHATITSANGNLNKILFLKLFSPISLEKYSPKKSYNPNPEQFNYAYSSD